MPEARQCADPVAHGDAKIAMYISPDTHLPPVFRMQNNLAADSATRIFLEHQTMLRKLAYQMLGSPSLAEDSVQDTWLRWNSADVQSIQTPKAWLVTVLSRLCIDTLRAEKKLRESYIGPWLPEPLWTEPVSDPAEAAEIRSGVSMALLLLMEALSPEERIAFLLFDVFDHDYVSVAQIMNKSSAACRQLVHRARKHLQRDTYAPESDISNTAPQRQQILQEFVAALYHLDLQHLLSLLAPEVRLISDGGGKIRAANKPVHGTRAVSRLLIGIRKLNQQLAGVEYHEFNGANALLGRAENGQASFLLQMELDEAQRIRQIFIINNPDKLRAIVFRPSNRQP